MDSQRVPWKGNIPMDLTEDILLRLPAKSLGRCMCTCKRWYSHVKSPQFIKKHLNRSKVKDHGVLIVQEGCYSIFTESNSTLIEQERGQIPVHVMERDLYILGSCMGLVLVRLQVERGWLVHLWNPLLNKFKLIDSITYDRPHCKAHVSSWLCAYGLGFNEATNDYRVVRIAMTSENCISEEVVDVYSLTEGNWHRVNGTLPNGILLQSIVDSHKIATYINGVVHWLSMYNFHEDEYFVILSFDFDTEVFKEIELPECCSSYELKFYAYELKKFNGKLAVFGVFYAPCDFYSMWVMKDYPLVESWTEIACSFEHKGEYDILHVAGTKKGNFIFRQINCEKSDTFRYYNAKDDKIYKVEVVAPYLYPVIVDFVDCLVLLDVKNDVLEDHTP